MSFESIFEHVRAAGSGFILGVLTAVWIHAVWTRSHPHRIRFWGAWYTDTRVLVVGGVALLVAWTALLLAT